MLYLCFCVSLIYFYFYFCFLCAPSWRRCPLLGNSLSVVFCLLSLLFSERVPGLIWFGSVYLMTTAGFVADQLMWGQKLFWRSIVVSTRFFSVNVEKEPADAGWDGRTETKFSGANGDRKHTHTHRPSLGKIHASGIEWLGLHLRGYVQFDKHTHTHSERGWERGWERRR